jgi:regulatory protein
MNPLSKPLIQQTLGYLSVRDRSEKEIRDYLSKKTTDLNLANEVVAYLNQHSLINDDRFGHQWAAARIRRAKGDIQIRRELLQKGLTKEQVQEILEGIDQSEWLQAMDSLLAKKITKYIHLDSYQQKGKIYQLLSQKGFSTKLIDAFLRRKVE